MRTIARHGTGRYGIAESSAPDHLCFDETIADAAGTASKVEFTSLLPGGMTLDAGTGISGFLHANSPELVIGFGAAKGWDTYYQAVRVFGSMQVIC